MSGLFERPPCRLRHHLYVGRQSLKLTLRSIVSPSHWASGSATRRWIDFQSPPAMSRKWFRLPNRTGARKPCYSSRAFHWRAQLQTTALARLSFNSLIYVTLNQAAAAEIFRLTFRLIALPDNSRLGQVSQNSHSERTIPGTYRSSANAQKECCAANGTRFDPGLIRRVSRSRRGHDFRGACLFTNSS